MQNEIKALTEDEQLYLYAEIIINILLKEILNENTDEESNSFAIEGLFQESKK